MDNEIYLESLEPEIYATIGDQNKNKQTKNDEDNSNRISMSSSGKEKTLFKIEKYEKIEKLILGYTSARSSFSEVVSSISSSSFSPMLTELRHSFSEWTEHNKGKEGRLWFPWTVSVSILFMIILIMSGISNYIL